MNLTRIVMEHQLIMHRGRHYGSVTTREALGRSLNIPALKTLQELA